MSHREWVHYIRFRIIKQSSDLFLYALTSSLIEHCKKNKSNYIFKSLKNIAVKFYGRSLRSYESFHHLLYETPRRTYSELCFKDYTTIFIKLWFMNANQTGENVENYQQLQKGESIFCKWEIRKHIIPPPLFHHLKLGRTVNDSFHTFSWIFFSQYLSI